MSPEPILKCPKCGATSRRTELEKKGECHYCGRGWFSRVSEWQVVAHVFFLRAELR